MIGWCPSFRVGVAVRPTTYLAFTCLMTCSNVKAEMWWHSSTITWPYSATKSFTSSFRYRLWITATSTQPVRSILPPPICPIDLAGRSKNHRRLRLIPFVHPPGALRGAADRPGTPGLVVVIVVIIVVDETEISHRLLHKDRKSTRLNSSHLG